MNIRDILKKLKSGEQLDEKEREEFATFDLDSVYAEARREAEKKAKAATELADQLRAKIEAINAERSAGEDTIDKLKAQIAELGKKIEARDKAAAEAARFARLDDELAKRGISAAKGTGFALRDAWRRRTEKLADLDDKVALDEAARLLREELPGLVADGGIRVPGTERSNSSQGITGNPFDPKSGNLTKALELIQSDPTLAAQLKQQAGL